jgi:hypothetical protein
MTDTTVPTPVPPPAVPVVKVTITPQMILENSLAKLPGFSARADLELLLMILATYVGCDVMPVKVQLGPEKALRNLIGFKKISSVEDVYAAHMNVMKALTASMSGVYSTFEAATGKKFSRSDFDAFEAEFNRENAEQDGLIGISEKAIEDVRIICGQLGLANPDPVLKSALVVAPKVDTLGRIGRSIKGAFIREAGSTSNTKTVSDQKPGWITPPVLDKRFYELADFLKMVIDYSKLLEEAKKTQPDINVAKDTLVYLESNGFARSDVLAKLTEYVTIARDQMEQSKEVKANIVPEFSEVNETVQGILDIKATADAVKAYFSSI